MKILLALDLFLALGSGGWVGEGWADWADGADRGDGTDGTDVAEMALRMNALFYFDCLGAIGVKNIYDIKMTMGLESFVLQLARMYGTDESHPLDYYNH